MLKSGREPVSWGDEVRRGAALIPRSILGSRPFLRETEVSPHICAPRSELIVIPMTGTNNNSWYQQLQASNFPGTDGANSLR